MFMSLELKNLQISIDNKIIIDDLSLTVKPGEVHVIMGPNGSGKSTLANAVFGHPKYTIGVGKVIVDKNDVTKKSPDKKAQAGLFLSMQYAPEIPGVTVAHFIRVATAAMTHENKNPFEFHEELKKMMKQLGMDTSFATRYLNTGFSGGEKKRTEILQLLMLKPTYAILDETDSGLDVDALRIVGAGINAFHSSKTGLILITHYNRLLEYVVPDFVHIMVKGKIIKSGGKELAKEIEKEGYKKFL